jgi:hypothetical protein
VTREGQLIFFAQFLCVGGRWERFVSNSPLTYERQPWQPSGRCAWHGTPPWVLAQGRVYTLHITQIERRFLRSKKLTTQNFVSPKLADSPTSTSRFVYCIDVALSWVQRGRCSGAASIHYTDQRQGKDV